MTPPIYDFLQKAIDQLRLKISQGKKRILIVSPTGSGKTSLAAEIIRLAHGKNKKIVFMAHREELVYQAHERLSHFGVDAGIIMANHKYNGHLVHVASVQTLVRRDHPPADIVFIDEVHHVNSASYLAILESYKYALIIGLTATPFRSDGKPLGEIFEDLIITASIQDLIDKNFLAQPRYFGAKLDLHDIAIKRGDYDNKQLFEYFDNKILYDGVVEKFKQFGIGKTLVFCVNIQHSKNTCQSFIDAGYTAAHIDCDTESQDRKRILKEFADGKYQILSNVAVFTEGYNLPTIQTIILNRATKSKGLYMQCVGRGLRTTEGKESCVVIDHGNNVYEHGPVEQEYEIDIHGKKKKKSVVVDTCNAKECPTCQSLVGTRTLICPHCGHEFPPEKETKLVEAEFEELIFPKIVIPEHLRKPWSKMNDAELEEYRALKGYKKGWCFFQRTMRDKKINQNLVGPCYIGQINE